MRGAPCHRKFTESCAASGWGSRGRGGQGGPAALSPLLTEKPRAAIALQVSALGLPRGSEHCLGLPPLGLRPALPHTYLLCDLRQVTYILQLSQASWVGVDAQPSLEIRIIPRTFSTTGVQSPPSAFWIQITLERAGRGIRTLTKVLRTKSKPLDWGT